MALIMKKLVVTLALAIFAGAWGGKAVALEVPEQQPAPVVEQKPVETKSTTAVSNEELLKRREEYRDATKPRIEGLKQEELQKVLTQDEVEDQILARAAEIERERARKSAESVVKKTDTSAMRTARREAERIDKSERNALKYAFESRRDTGLMCPIQTDEQSVWINPTVAKTYQFRSHTRVTVTNLTDAPVNIRRVSGRDASVVVRNLCPGGSMTMWEVLETFLMDQMVVGYAAQTSSGMSYSQPVQAYRCLGNGCQKEFVAVWEIRSQR